MAGRIIEAELRITGSDKSGAAFAGVIKHAQELQRVLGKGMKVADPGFAKHNAEIREQTRLLQSERRAVQELQRSLALVNGEMARHTGLISRAKGLYNSGAGQLGLMATGAMAGHTVRRTATDAADLAHQRALLTAGGMNGAEVKEAVAAAWKASSRVPTVTAADSLKAIGELRMVFGDTHDAIKHLEPVLKATAAIRAVNPHMDAESEAYNIARALEMKGVSNDPHHFTNLLGRMTQAVNASRGKVTGSEFFQFVKYSRAAAPGLSDDFFTTVAPTLINELGGHSAGTALASMRQAIIGGKVKASAAEQFEKLGLLNPKSVIRTKGGNVLGFRPGGMQGSALFDKDPYLWTHRVLKPAMDKKGITDPDKIKALLAALFGNRNAEQFASILFSQKQRIEKDRALIQGAPNADSIDQLKRDDPKTAMRDLSAAVTNFLAAAGSPLMGTAVSALNSLADGMRGLGQGAANFGKNYPVMAGGAAAGAAVGAGYLGYKGIEAMLGGFGLKGSAAALTGSAAALDAAALHLRGGSAVKDIVNKENVTKAGIGAAVWRYGKKAARFGLRFGGAPAMYFGAIDPAGEGSTVNGPGSFTLRNLHERMGLPIDYEAERERRGRFPSISGALGRAPVKAELEGTVKTEVSVKVEPSPDFISRVTSSVKSFFGQGINGAPATGTTGSTGRSMPEASSCPMP